MSVDSGHTLPDELLHRLRLLDVLERIAQISHSSESIKDVVGSILELTLEIFHADRAWIVYTSTPGEALSGVPLERTRPGWSRHFEHGYVMPAGAGASEILMEILETNGPIQYGPDTDHPFPPISAEDFSIKSQLMMVLRPRVGSPWLFGLHHCADPLMHDINELQIFTFIAQRISDTLGVLMTIGQLRTRENFSDGLAELVIERAGVLLVVLDMDGRIRLFNRACERLSEYSFSEAEGKYPWDFLIPPEEAEVVRRKAFDAMAHNPGNMEGRFTNHWQSKSGKRHLIDWTNTLLLDSAGKMEFMVSVGVDITERMRAEQMLKQSEEKFRSIIEAIPVPLALNDERGNITYLNQAFINSVGYTRDDVATLADWWPRAYPDPQYRKWVADNWQAHLEEAKQYGTAFVPIEINVTCKSGMTRTFLASAASLQEKFSDNHLVILFDISERIKADQSLKESAENRRIIFETLSEGVALNEMIFNDDGEMIDYRIVEVNPAFYQTADYNKQSKVIGQFATVLYMMDVEAIKSFWSSHKNDTVTVHSEMISPISNKVFSISASPFVNNRFVTTFRDITEQKRYAQELQLSQTRLAGIISSALDGIVTVDANQRIILFNHAAEGIFGFNTSEILGQPLEVLLPERFHAKHRQYVEAFGKSDEITRSMGKPSLIYGLRSNGEEFPLEVSISHSEVMGEKNFTFILRDVTEKVKKDHLIQTQANFDPLTNLPNRRLFHDRLEMEIQKLHRSGLPLVLFLVDLDNFKDINDTLGHAKGDILLQEAAQRISSCVREGDTVARLGGDEFTVILPELGDKFRIESIARNIILELNKPFCLDQQEVKYHISASIGITIYPEDAHDIEGMLKHVDQALYNAKAEGRGRFSYFTLSMQQDANEKQAIIHDLRHALARNEMQVFFQPIIDLATGQISKAEALLRWKHPQRGMISPAIFIPLAEKSGLILDIGEWVFEQTIANIEKWRRRFNRIIQVSVNKSPIQFEQAGKQSWSESLIRMGLPGNCITVEITEGLLLKQSRQVKEHLMEFQYSGIEVSIDDFGTGFSSLSYITQFDIDYLKIDRSFVCNLTTNESHRALTEAIIVMAHKLGIKTVAEGVETEEQRDLLLNFGCDYAQGFLYSQAIPEAEFTKMIEQQEQ